MEKVVRKVPHHTHPLRRPCKTVNHVHSNDINFHGKRTVMQSKKIHFPFLPIYKYIDQDLQKL